MQTKAEMFQRVKKKKQLSIIHLYELLKLKYLMFFFFFKFGNYPTGRPSF